MLKFKKNMSVQMGKFSINSRVKENIVFRGGVLSGNFQVRSASLSSQRLWAKYHLYIDFTDIIWQIAVINVAFKGLSGSRGQNYFIRGPFPLQ